MLYYIKMLIPAILGAFAYRWRGMSGDDFPPFLQPRIVRRVLFALIIGLSVIYPFGLEYWYIAVAAAILSFYGIVVGHGSYFKRDPDTPNVDNENFAFITSLIADPLNNKARFVGMALTGLALTAPLGCGLVFLYHYFLVNPVAEIAAVALMFSGIGKAVIYWSTPNTEKAEIVWGFYMAGIFPLLYELNKTIM